MNFSFKWLDPQTACISLDAPDRGEMGWEGFFAFFNRALEDVRSQDGPVHVIVDLLYPLPLPEEDIGTLDHLSSEDWPPQNVALLVIVNPSPEAQLFVDMFVAPFFPVKQASSREEAVQIATTYQNGSK